MTEKQALDKTIDLWYEAWEKGDSEPIGCPVCWRTHCAKCLFGLGRFDTTCSFLLRELSIKGNVAETLRHLLQLRLYLYGDVKRWTVGKV